MIEQYIDDGVPLIKIMNEIEEIRKGSHDYMDAIITYCDRHDVEVETIAQYVKNNLVLKAKLQEEAEDQNYIQKTARLPI